MSSDQNCIFCKIVCGEAPSEILFQNDEIIVFKDIKPASKHHYLVVPKNHIINVNHLVTKEDKLLVQKMKEIGNRLLELNGGDSKDARLGFHCPPYNTVDHLHLHVISPVSEMEPYYQQVFQPHLLCFLLVDDVLKKLTK
ncbi:adenosine 5'-monophosphoramidase HINT3-like isoform X2 [Diorhabda carinulata]|uniref:adenosine 5'-monophosphoramidase HINT3-like isoform X2 n=1 Tax=Diorhabda carinulata TaxID=1163345 RepID=UPI0025A01840|nr:adenosine 5'-monophosphoramidase HINT3-like isoform X2 [Diorhabda carinulata]